MIYKFKYTIGDYAVINMGDGLAMGEILDHYLDPMPLYKIDLVYDDRYKSIVDAGERRIFLTIKPGDANG